MQFNHYGGTGAFLAAALANATDFRPAALERLLTEHEMTSRRLDRAQAAVLAGWLDRVRPVFGEPDPARQIRLVNALLADATTSVRISTHEGHPPHLHYITGTDDRLARIKATIAGGLAVALCGAGGHRLGRCGRSGCPIVYVDTSRNGRRRFCSLACANRVNVAAHRARARPAA
ncbi:CGNR zinc finger domain-containing protein [Phytohabitans sp. ZYX-F-186]|uniref:CGNR zinc finger domain-containing protein n=1 Tax=Phytohabitans maris TaxID=3071409 RepID=A0ABU0ZRE7_9ACTN|nr:CGNR zinc finger domain-containing protein [Phytohabitans sp. ZYX-F-186]MDQ7909603.1 CGNR zinc finger domain-containing protein [Phytohabitans sp. ZYX-F-186]